MAVHGKDYGKKPPTAFPKTLEIERTDSHIPSAPAATAKLIQIQNPKGAFPSSPDLPSLQAHPSIGKDCCKLGGCESIEIHYCWERV
jgi:hypothetical protein